MMEDDTVSILVFLDRRDMLSDKLVHNNNFDVYEDIFENIRVILKKETVTFDDNTSLVSPKFSKYTAIHLKFSRVIQDKNGNVKDCSLILVWHGLIEPGDHLSLFECQKDWRTGEKPPEPIPAGLNQPYCMKTRTLSQNLQTHVCRNSGNVPVSINFVMEFSSGSKLMDQNYERNEIHRYYCPGVGIPQKEHRTKPEIYHVFNTADIAINDIVMDRFDSQGVVSHLLYGGMPAF